MITSESREQMLFVQWMRQNYKEHRIFHIPNGGARSLIEAGRLKAEGVSKGIPDLFVPSLKLWIEMKKEVGGRVSPEQKDWIEYLETVGYHCIIGKGFEDAKAKTLKYLSYATDSKS